MRAGRGAGDRHGARARRRRACSRRSGSRSATSGATRCARWSSRSTGAELPADGEADIRYAGQSFELTVPLGGDVAEAFHRAHEERYGYADRSRPLELVALRTADVRPGPEYVHTHASPRPAATGLVELDGSTAWIPPGWRGDWRDGSLVVTRT